MTISVEVSSGNRDSILPIHKISAGKTERSTRPGHCKFGEIGVEANSNNVGPAIPIKVCQDEFTGVRKLVIGNRRKSPFACIQQNAFVDKQVWLPVTIEIPHHNVVHVLAEVISDRSLERSVSVAKQHADAMKRGADQIQFPVSVKVGNRRATLKALDGLHSLKGSVAVRELDSEPTNKIR